MLRIKRFQGLYAPADRVARVSCVPYDVVSRAEAFALASDEPESLLHVDRAEIDLPEKIDPYSPIVYATAQKKFRELQDNGCLLREEGPCIYLYQQQMGTHVQTGIAAVCHIDDYETDIIKKHEKTRPDKEDDRTRLIDALSANTGPVFLTYRDRPQLDALVGKALTSTPLYDFSAPDGVAHRVWRIANASPFIEQFAQLSAAYVADGHHRTASAARVGRERRARNTKHTGEEEYNWFLAVLFPGSQLQILPYNRAVKDLNGHTVEEFIEAVRRNFEMDDIDVGSESLKPGRVRMYFEGIWRALSWNSAEATDPISSLDVSALQDRLLAPILGIDDPRTSKRIDFVGGIRGEEELVRLVDSREAAVAFSMFPTTVDQLMAIADAGQIMPPKSTWFEPKLRSGLFIHTF